LARGFKERWQAIRGAAGRLRKSCPSANPEALRALAELDWQIARLLLRLESTQGDEAARFTMSYAHLSRLRLDYQVRLGLVPPSPRAERRAEDEEEEATAVAVMREYARKERGAQDGARSV
jgi:hypothetical protein